MTQAGKAERSGRNGRRETTTAPWHRHRTRRDARARRYRRETPGRAEGETERDSKRGRHRKEGVGTEIDGGLSCISLVSGAHSLRKRSDARQGCT